VDRHTTTISDTNSSSQSSFRTSTSIPATVPLVDQRIRGSIPPKVPEEASPTLIPIYSREMDCDKSEIDKVVCNMTFRVSGRDPIPEQSDVQSACLLSEKKLTRTSGLGTPASEGPIQAKKKTETRANLIMRAV